MRVASGAFSFVEVLVSVAVTALILVAMLAFIGSATQISHTRSSDPFADAAAAFETIASSVPTATLEPYRDYADATGAFRTSTSPATFAPDHLALRSDLAFVCGPAAGASGLLTGSGRTTTGDALFLIAPAGYTQTLAHTGMERLLNAQGYFVDFGAASTTPSFINGATPSWRWRLRQVMQPAENLQVYAPNTASGSAWITAAVQTTAPTPVLAENVIALVALPEPAVGTVATSPATYLYNSRDATSAATYNQLPSRLRLMLAAIDEISAQRLAALDGSTPPALLPSGLFIDATKLDADIATLDQTLTAQKIGHRIFQRTVELSAAFVSTP